MLLCCCPLLPLTLGRTDGQVGRLAEAPHQRELEQCWFRHQPLDPTRRRILSVPQSQLLIPLRLPVDERVEAKTLDEPLELAFGDFAFSEIHEVRANAPLGKKPERLACLRAFAEPEDLNFHRS